MRNFLSTLFVASALFVVSSANAQDFPATEKEVKEIICSGAWTLDSLGTPGKMKAAAELSMEGTNITFKEDGTYVATVFARDKAGKWTIALADKQVNMYEKTKDPESIIKRITKDQLVMESGDGSDLKMIFRQDK
jgi:hypothetical protein